jgi:hypothetical protein
MLIEFKPKTGTTQTFTKNKQIRLLKNNELNMRNTSCVFE